MRNSSEGLSLVETMMAIVILGVALIAITFLFSQARGTIEVSGRGRRGLAVAQEKMETLKDLPYLDTDLAKGIHSDRVDLSGDVAADGVFFREWTVTAVADDANGTLEPMDYKLVDVRVYDQRLDPESSALNDPDKLVARLRSYVSP